MAQLVAALKSLHRDVLTEIEKALRQFDATNPILAYTAITTAQNKPNDCYDTIIEIEKKIKEF
jgi:hypothetical protein